MMLTLLLAAQMPDGKVEGGDPIATVRRCAVTAAAQAPDELEAAEVAPTIARSCVGSLPQVDCSGPAFAGDETCPAAVAQVYEHYRAAAEREAYQAIVARRQR